jgi:hypothetical protein
MQAVVMTELFPVYQVWRAGVTAARRVNLKNRVTPLLPMYTIISFIRCKSSSTTTHPYLYCYKKVYIDIVTVFTFVLVLFDYAIFYMLFYMVFSKFRLVRKTILRTMTTMTISE